MRIAIISDIHANLEALQSVLSLLGRLKIDRYVCLGDFVGYGANPEEVISLLRVMCDTSVMGNHDAAVCGQMDFTHYYGEAREVLLWTKDAMSAEAGQFLCELPYFRVEGDICWVHGSPVDPAEFHYVYTLDQAQMLVKHYDNLKDITFVGHSHLRRIYEIYPDRALEINVDNFTMQDGRKYIIAVGSVGQPRDYDPRAAFVIYDIDNRRVEFYRVPYDIDKAAEKIINAGLPEFFASRLYSGS